MSRLPWLLPVAALSLACPGPVDSGMPVLAEGPVLEHVPPEQTLVEGDELGLEVSASDPDGVAELRLYFRDAGDDSWGWSDMEEAGELWTATVTVDEPGLEYYFKGTDSGDPQAVSYLPAGAGNDPYALDVLVQALELPFYESFGLDEGQDELRDLGWVSYEAEFPGYPWELTEGGPDGDPYVRHAIGNGDASDLMDDWLIAPALDFSGLEFVQLSWWETGSQTEHADHELWYSLDSRNPEDGGYVLHSTLEAPGEDWDRAAIVDLSELSGEPVVYLAWRYQGADADSWSIDAVAVEALAPDLSAAVTTSPEVVHPGDSVTFDIFVSNATDSEAEDVLLGLQLDMGKGGSVDESLELGDIAALSEGSGSFEVELATGLPDNSRLPYTITMDSGEQTWSQSFELQLGYPSTATVAYTLDSTSLVEISLGVGDPAEPSEEWTVLTATESAGSGSIEVDVTDLYELLPPAAGELRWFARVTANGDGSVDGFTLDYGDELYEATELPELIAEEEVVVYLPEPPAFVVNSWTTSEDTLQPGQTGVSFASLSVYNQGAASTGSVVATLSCADEGITVLDGGPLLVAEDGWDPGRTITLSDTFLFHVAPDKTDSEPVTFLLELSDDVESFGVEVEVEVPWPVLRIVRVTVEDDDNDDGILDPGETATLDIEVANAGDQGTDGIARGTLSLLGTSTGSASVDPDDQSFGQIDAGDSRSEDFELVVTDGAVGDTLDLRLDVVDGTSAFSPTFQFVLGEPPWLAAAAVDDATGDAVDDYEFDWVNAWYRVYEGMFQLRCEATDTVDAKTVFIEGWGSSSVSDYTFYQLIVSGGAADLLGWPDNSSHYSIATPSYSVEDNEVLLEWDPAVMGLSIDEFSMGFGAGWCGPPTYYCDHLPDGWGYAYDSAGMDSGEWLDFEW